LSGQLTRQQLTVLILALTTTAMVPPLLFAIPGPAVSGALAAFSLLAPLFSAAVFLVVLLIVVFNDQSV